MRKISPNSTDRPERNAEYDAGVDINDKQPSIRGGNGWTYGVGSRSLVLIDGMSALTSGTGIINWNIVPLENIEQVEVMKGASSVLYGSSALNGVINIRTKRPSLTPVTTLRTYLGIYGDPDNEEYRWSDKSFWKEGKYEVEPFLRKNVFSGIPQPDIRRDRLLPCPPYREFRRIGRTEYVYRRRIQGARAITNVSVPVVT